MTDAPPHWFMTLFSNFEQRLQTIIKKRLDDIVSKVKDQMTSLEFNEALKLR